MNVMTKNGLKLCSHILMAYIEKTKVQQDMPKLRKNS